jgi:hypothetical protein
VYEAGHEAPAYQPETAYKIFTRLLFNKDIATGEVDTLTNSSYSTGGPADIWAFRTEGPQQPAQFCYVLDTETCTAEQLDVLEAGGEGVVIKDYILVDENSTAIWPDLASASENITGTGPPPATESYTGGAVIGASAASLMSAIWLAAALTAGVLLW